MRDRTKAQSIRMYADEELAPDEAAELRRSLEADEKQRRWVEFEQRLRERVASVMEREAPAVPVDLAARVRAALDDADASGADEEPPLKFMRWFAAPRRANAFAVAACLVLVAGAILWGIFGPQIDHGIQAAGLMPQVASHVAEEHLRNATDPTMLASSVPFATREHARERLPDYLASRTIHVPDISSAGYQLVGGGPCRLPGCDLACHLFYERIGGSAGRHHAMASLHVAIDETRGAGRVDDFAEMPLGGRVIPKQSGCPIDVFMWSDGSCIYFLVCCDPRDLMTLARQMQEEQIRR